MDKDCGDDDAEYDDLDGSPMEEDDMDIDDNVET